MIRATAAKAQFLGEKGFRWRGGDVSRIEGFSDAVFGFAVTLLVLSLEVPRNFAGLKAAMAGIPAFFVSFLVLLGVWRSHYIFFRRYGLQDMRCLMLNSLLLFVVLCYIYPLKYLFTLLVNGFLGGTTSDLIDWRTDGVLMLTFFAVGFVALYAIFALLYKHAWDQRDALELNEIERFDTRNSIQGELSAVGVGLLSLAFVQIGGQRYLLPAGLCYWGLLAIRIVQRSRGRRARRLIEVRLGITEEGDA